MSARNYSSTAAQTTLSSSVDASATTLTVSATTGFPSVPFILAVDAGAAGQELVLVTNVAGTNLTVTRGYDSTVAVAHDTGAVVQHSHGAIDFREANQHINATTGVHGLTGAPVGTTDTQTLTNKTLTNPVINGVSGTPFAWQTHTPTVTSEGGSITAYTAALKYMQTGKKVEYVATISITTPGTASGQLRFTVPVAEAAGVQLVGYGRETVATGTMLQVIRNSASIFAVVAYDNSTSVFWTAGRQIVVRGTYEVA